MGTGIGLLHNPDLVTPSVYCGKMCAFTLSLSADDKQGENTRIGVDLHWRNWISHGSCFTPLRNWVDEMPKTKATPLLFCPCFDTALQSWGSVRAASRSKHGCYSSELDVPGSEVNVSSSEVNVSSSEVEGSSFEVEVSGSVACFCEAVLGMSCSEVDVSYFEVEDSRSRLGVLCFELGV